MNKNKLFETLLDVIPFAAYAVDIKSYKVVYANKLMRKNMHVPKASHCWKKIFGQEEICSWCNILKLQELQSQNEEKYSCEFFDEAGDRWIKSYDEIVSWADAKEVKYSILVDISEQKEMLGSAMKAHATLALNTKQIMRTNKNLQITKLKLQKSLNELRIEKQKAEELTKTKSNFLSNMSHEIRTPMNGILGMTYLVKQTYLDETQRNYVEKIESSSKNLLNIIDDILDFSKIEAGKLAIENIYFDMKELINDVKNVTELKADEKFLEFNIIHNSKNFIYFGDPLRIGQILINLVSNAIKFTNSGKVTLTIEQASTENIRFEVKDTGVGISKHQQKDLFQSFSQADESITRKYGGTGLGLSISKQLVELMNGRIWFESELDVGSSFIFEIRLPHGGKSIIEKTTDENNLNQKIKTLATSRILLVEDNTTNQLIVIGLLKDSGILIDIANNGQEAVDKFNENEYELIFMDLQMPIMDGYEATKIIREKSVDIPIIALTANAMKEDVQKSKKAGMNENLSKPIDIEKLYETLLKYIPKKVRVINSNDKTNLLLSEDLKNELFFKLNKAIESKRPKEYKPIVKELQKYKLTDADEKIFEDVTTSLNRYKFKEASVVLEKILKVKG